MKFEFAISPPFTDYQILEDAVPDKLTTPQVQQKRLIF